MAVLDTNVYINLWERRLAEETVARIHESFVVRHAAVVLSELRRGARSQQARRTVEALRRMAAEVWEPSASDWWDAGKFVRDIGDHRHWDVHKRREFQNDVVLALTVRRHGALLVTANHDDFRLLERPLALRVHYV